MGCMGMIGGPASIINSTKRCVALGWTEVGRQNGSKRLSIGWRDQPTARQHQVDFREGAEEEAGGEAEAWARRDTRKKRHMIVTNKANARAMPKAVCHATWPDPSSGTAPSAAEGGASGDDVGSTAVGWAGGMGCTRLDPSPTEK